MKQAKTFCFSDEICGKETADYINEFSPHRLSLIRFEEDSEEIFDADEEKTVLKQ
jgi:hypothetical protein